MNRRSTARYNHNYERYDQWSFINLIHATVCYLISRWRTINQTKSTCSV